MVEEKDVGGIDVVEGLRADFEVEVEVEVPCGRRGRGRTGA